MSAKQTATPYDRANAAFADVAIGLQRRGIPPDAVMGAMMLNLATIAIRERMSVEEFVRHAKEHAEGAKRTSDELRGPLNSIKRALH